ncbi:MAG: hypothetical protein RR253_00680 [Oscillospiraceae bacterium]
MPDYKSMYYLLFQQVSKTIEELQKAQQAAEELYISSGEEEEITDMCSPIFGEEIGKLQDLLRENNKAIDEKDD